MNGPIYLFFCRKYLQQKTKNYLTEYRRKMKKSGHTPFSEEGKKKEKKRIQVSIVKEWGKKYGNVENTAYTFNLTTTPTNKTA